MSSKPDVELEMGPEEELSHLHETARPVARLPAAERLTRVRADRWIGYTRATQALNRLHKLLTWPAKQRMPNLLVIGPTNNGKSMIVEKFRRSHPPIFHPDREEIPVLTVQMPSDPQVARFYTALLSALGAPLRPRQRLAELEQVALQLLRQATVRMLVIDELHNVLAGRGDTRREFLNLLRFLGNELKIPLVGVGTRDAYLAIRSDDQLAIRFAPFTLPRWQPDREASALLASFAAAFPLRRPSHLATPEMTEYLLTRSEATIGELAALLTEAAVAAIESGEEAINQRTLLWRPTRGRPSGAACSNANLHEVRRARPPLAGAPATSSGRGADLLARPPGEHLPPVAAPSAAAHPRPGLRSTGRPRCR